MDAGDGTRLLTDRDVRRLLVAAMGTRYPRRNRAIVLLAVEAGLTPLEMSRMVRADAQADDGVVGGLIEVTSAKAGRRLSARRIPLAPKGRLRRALVDMLDNVPGKPGDPLILSERALEDHKAAAEAGKAETGTPLSPLNPMRPTSISYVLWKLAAAAGIEMVGARDARRTFIVMAGRAVRGVGGNARDVQELAGHRSLESTQRLMEADWEAQQRAVAAFGNLFETTNR